MATVVLETDAWILRFVGGGEMVGSCALLFVLVDTDVRSAILRFAGADVGEGIVRLCLWVWKREERRKSG